MNIVEFLKERKQVLKISAIALMGAAAVYMMPAHMSSAMMSGGDDGEPKSSQVDAESKDDVSQSAQQATLANLATDDCLDYEVPTVGNDSTFEQKRSMIEFVGDNMVSVDDGKKWLTYNEREDSNGEISITDNTFMSTQSCIFDVSESFDAKKILSEAADKLVELGEAFSLKDFLRLYTNLSIKEISIRGKGRVSLDKNAVGNWSLSLLNDDFMVRDFCEFDMSEEFDTTKFLSDAVDKLIELCDAFSLKDFVRSYANLSIKEIYIRGKGRLKLNKYDENCSLSLLNDDFMVRDFCEFDTSEEFDTTRFLSDAVDKLIELGDAFSLKEFVGSYPNLKLTKYDSEESFDVLGQESTKAKEVEFSLKLIKGLPTSEEELKKFSELPNESDLNEHDKKVYEDIKEVIRKLKEDVEKDTSTKSEQMKKANAVYCWVANNIDYDHYDQIRDQNAFSVFECKKGVCCGYSCLINLMMRMMEIPSLYISAFGDRSEISGHAYNAIYVDGGWTLMDATWAHQNTCQYDKCFFDSRKADLKNDISDKLNDSFIDLLYDANTKENSGLVYDYGESIKREIVRVISENKDMVESDMKKVNDAMSKILDKVNPMYESLNKIAKIKLELDSEDKAFSMYPTDRFLSRLRLRIDLSENAKKYINDINEESLRIYFPAYYLDMSFDDANRKMVSLEYHSIHFFVIGIREDDAFNPYVDSMRYENGLVCFLDGYEGNVKLCLRGGEDQSLENVIIPEEIFDYGFPVEVGINIQSLVLKGYEKSFQASNLKNIDATQSDSHIVEDGILYEKKDGKKGDIICAFNAYREVKGMMCHIRTSEDGKKIEKVFLASSEDMLDVGILPPEIIKYEAPIMISGGIRSFKVTGDTIIELVGSDIEAIDASESSRYIVEDGVLYEKDTDGNKGAQVAVFNQKVDKGAYKYFVKSSETILICGNESSPLKDFHIPEDLIKQYGYIEIGLGIESLILKGDDIVLFRKAKDLKKVDIRESNIYIKVEGKLCKHGKFHPHPTDLPAGVEIVD